MDVMELMVAVGDGVERDRLRWFQTNLHQDRRLRADGGDGSSKYAGHDVSCCKQAAQTMKAGASE